MHGRARLPLDCDNQALCDDQAPRGPPTPERDDVGEAQKMIRHQGWTGPEPEADTWTCPVCDKFFEGEHKATHLKSNSDGKQVEWKAAQERGLDMIKEEGYEQPATGGL